MINAFRIINITRNLKKFSIYSSNFVNQHRTYLETFQIPNILHTKHTTTSIFHILNNPYPKIAHSQNCTFQTSHIPNIPHPRQTTFYTSHIPNIPHPKHSASQTSYIQNITHLEPPYLQHTMPRTCNIPNTLHSKHTTILKLHIPIWNTSYSKHTTSQTSHIPSIPYFRTSHIPSDTVVCLAGKVLVPGFGLTKLLLYSGNLSRFSNLLALLTKLMKKYFTQLF